MVILCLGSQEMNKQALPTTVVKCFVFLSFYFFQWVLTILPRSVLNSWAQDILLPQHLSSWAYKHTLCLPHWANLWWWLNSERYHCSIQITWCEYQCPIPVSSAHLITRKQTPFLPRWPQTRDNKSMCLHESLLTLQTLWFLSPKLGVSKLFWRGETATKNIYRTVHPAPAHHNLSSHGNQLWIWVSDLPDRLQPPKLRSRAENPSWVYNALLATERHTEWDFFALFCIWHESTISPRLLPTYDPPASVSWV